MDYTPTKATYKGLPVPKLQKCNLDAAKEVLKFMRDNDRCISNSSLMRIVNKSRGWNRFHVDNMLSQNYDNIKAYLVNRGLIEVAGSGQLTYWLLTDKGYRTHWDNLFEPTYRITTKEVKACEKFIEEMFQYMEPTQVAKYFVDKGMLEFSGKYTTLFLECFPLAARESEEVEEILPLTFRMMGKNVVIV